jgi:predicted RNase H-like HicB family nuclease
MTDYALYLESGPRHRKTMVHVPALLGCIATGPTSEAAVAATPDAIRTFLRFLRRAGEPVDPEAPFETHVAQHIDDKSVIWLGNGSPYVAFETDFAPVSETELATYTARFQAMRDVLIAWAESQTEAALDAETEAGRTNRAVLLHTLGAASSYLSPVLGTISGSSRLHTLAERGELPVTEALRQSGALVIERLRTVTAAERSAVIEREKETRTLRKGIRRLLEHEWEHLAELSRRRDGPRL